jgi:glycosyltransferase involved in cell wall biosynthesis
MPAYNAEKYLAEAIESILNQTFQEFEFIIVNDGSTDNTLAIIQHYAAQDRRIRVLQTDHVGGGAARNVGVEVAKYDWIAMMDADDISLPQRLEKQIKAAQKHPDVVIWGTYANKINVKGKILSKNQFLGPTTQEEFYAMRQRGEEIYVLHATVLFKKDIFLKEGGYIPKFEGAEDSELFDRISDHGPILALPECLFLYRFHGESVSKNNFFHQKRLGEYLKYRRQAKLKGQRALSLEAFLQQQHKWAKLKFYYVTLNLFCYRQVTLCYGEKRYGCMIFCLGLTTILSPLASSLRLLKHFF